MKREPLGLIALLASRAPGDSGLGASEPQVFVMLAAALVVLVAFSLYLPLFFSHRPGSCRWRCCRGGY